MAHLWLANSQVIGPLSLFVRPGDDRGWRTEKMANISLARNFNQQNIDSQDGGADGLELEHNARRVFAESFGLSAWKNSQWNRISFDFFHPNLKTIAGGWSLSGSGCGQRVRCGKLRPTCREELAMDAFCVIVQRTQYGNTKSKIPGSSLQRLLRFYGCCLLHGETFLILRAFDHQQNWRNGSERIGLHGVWLCKKNINMLQR